MTAITPDRVVRALCAAGLPATLDVDPISGLPASQHGLGVAWDPLNPVFRDAVTVCLQFGAVPYGPPSQQTERQHYEYAWIYERAVAALFAAGFAPHSRRGWRGPIAVAVDVVQEDEPPARPALPVLYDMACRNRLTSPDLDWDAILAADEAGD